MTGMEHGQPNPVVSMTSTRPILRALLALATLFQAASASAQQEPTTATPPGVAQIETQYEAARQTATAMIQARYKSDLTALQDRYTKSGNLEGAVAVKAELDAVFSFTSDPPIPPPKASLTEFNQLQKRYTEDMQSALAAAQQRRKADLATLQGRLTRDGDLQGAIAVKNAIEALPITGKWRTMTGEISFVITFNADGTWSRTGHDKTKPADYTGTWKWSNPSRTKLAIRWDSPDWHNDGDLLPDAKRIDLRVNNYRQTIYRIP